MVAILSVFDLRIRGCLQVSSHVHLGNVLLKELLSISSGNHFIDDAFFISILAVKFHVDFLVVDLVEYRFIVIHKEQVSYLIKEHVLPIDFIFDKNKVFNEIVLF